MLTQMPAFSAVLPRSFASIAKLAGEQLGPHIVRIIPRLYRYLYDPNGKVGGRVWAFHVVYCVYLAPPRRR